MRLEEIAKLDPSQGPRWARMDDQHPRGVPVVRNDRYWLYGEEKEDGWHITGPRMCREHGLDEVHIPAMVNGKPVVSFHINWTYDPEWPMYVEKLVFPDCIPGIDGDSLRYVYEAEVIATPNPCWKAVNDLLLTLDGKRVVTCLKRIEPTIPVPKKVRDMMPQQDAHLLDSLLHRRLLRVTVPEGVEAIGERAFWNCNVSYVFLPDTLREIGVSAFEHTCLRSIIIPDGVKKIGDEAFSCSGLQGVYLPERLEELGNGAFSDTSLLEVTIPAGVRELHGVFEYCGSLCRVHLSEGLEKIGADTFHRCESLRVVNIPTTVKSIGKSAFRNCCALRQITLPEGLQEVHDDVFRNTSMTEVVLPWGATVIPVSDTPYLDEVDMVGMFYAEMDEPDAEDATP